MEFAQTQYWLTRFCFQRALGFIYFIAFLGALNQFRPLLGEKGLSPVSFFVNRIDFWDSPSLFFFNSSDRFSITILSIGFVLSILAVTGLSDFFGIAVSTVVWFLLWAIYLSLVNVGQTWYGFGWESILLETGFLAIFLGSTKTAPPEIVIWLLRWILFRIMFGAGLIKLRGDPCWRDLTCLNYHYETQPIPNPLSWYFHHNPVWFHKLEVFFTHFVELVLPFGIFLPRPSCYIAGGIMIFFQITLILSGNLSWLNYVTLVLCIPCFDDAFLKRFIPMQILATEAIKGARFVVLTALAILIGVLSIRPVLNLFSRRQIMNTSYDPLHLVGTYGAFGSITKERYEIIIEGTNDDPKNAEAVWKEYEFKAKPGDVKRKPAIVSPYHLRLDWLMWFAAMGEAWHYPWFEKLLVKMLEGDSKVLGLLANNPFAAAPPRTVRAQLYLYQFSSPEEKKQGYWWRRTRVREYFPPVSLKASAQ